MHQLARAHPRAAAARFTRSVARRTCAAPAREPLRDVGEPTLAVENGEHLPWADGTFDALTSVYLFHELPRNARRNVVREMMRVVKPGGVVVIEDSAQLADSAAIGDALRDFPKEFHEPFFDDYLEDDLAGLLRECGWRDVESESQLVARVVVGRK